MKIERRGKKSAQSGPADKTEKDPHCKMRNKDNWGEIVDVEDI
jgi:hypothetical protein